MNITALFLDCIVFTLDMEVILNLPEGEHVAEYDWFLVTSDVYFNHINCKGIGVHHEYGYDQFIIGKKQE